MLVQRDRTHGAMLAIFTDGGWLFGQGLGGMVQRHHTCTLRTHALQLGQALLGWK